MPPSVPKRLRVAASAVCVRDDSILLSHYIGGDRPLWTLPGGGLEHGEDPADAALRELTEETGYTGSIERMLGVLSQHEPPQASGFPWDFHGLRIIYQVAIVGGGLRDEVGGSTDQARWFPLTSVATLDRDAQVGCGLDLLRLRPADGRPPRKHENVWPTVESDQSPLGSSD